jgi:regulatory protein
MGKSAFEKGTEYLCYKDRTEKEVRNYLLSKDYLPKKVEDAINKLKEYSYINDEKYVCNYIQYKGVNQYFGPEKVKMDLAEKGINRFLLEKIDEIYTIEKINESAQKLFSVLNRKYYGLPLKSKQNKIFNAMVRKGYSVSYVREFDFLVQMENNEDEQSIIKDKLIKDFEKYYNKYYNKGKNRYIENQKIKQALYRKGYNQEMINEVIKENQNEGE